MFHYWPEDSAEARDFSTILVGLFSESTQGAADPNELLRVAAAIRAGDRDDWTRAFLHIANTVLSIAEQAIRDGHRQTAAESYLRAFTYFRVAELMRWPDDPQKIELYRRSIDCFRHGLTASHHRYEAVSFPFDGHRLEGYFFPAREERAPCVIFLSGADALPEQNFFRGAQWLTSRGLSCFVFNGPGQGGTIRLLKVPTLPEYERPVGAAIDYLGTRIDVDAERIGVLGVSMAGYYGMRAAAFEPRIKAVVAWGAMYSVYEDLWQHYPPLRRQLVWITGSRDQTEAQAKLRAFTLESILDRVRIPALITHGVNDEMVPVESARRTYREIASADKALRLYAPEDAGDTHINIDNWSQVVPVMADWLADRLNR
jgi:dipeptidyl aminopeptidase/acylaminoacyl peptidase